MATQVEVSAALAPLTNIGELRTETTLQRNFVGPFSDPSTKNGDERNKFVTPVRLSTMPPAASRPRLTPRPFSRERSWETFAVVKPPVPTLKPAPNSSSEDPAAAAAAAKGSTGNVPPLLDQKLIENKSSRDLVDLGKWIYPTPQANTIILFETGSNEKGKVRANPDKMSAVPKVQQETPSETSRKLEAVHRQQSLSMEPKPVSGTPRKSLERKETFSESDDVGKDPSRTSEVPLQPKQRPVSAIFLESLKDQKTKVDDLPDEAKPVPEKPLGRKPRPLSMDLTAKFENISAQKRSCVAESQETAGLSSADSSNPNPTVVDKSKSATQIRKSALDEASPKDLSHRKNPWEVWRKSQDDEKERGSAFAEISDKSKVPSSKERITLNRNESRSEIENSAVPPEVENKASKGVGGKKSADFSDSLAKGSSTANAESLPESSGKETRVMNIQQRIKELTGDNADLKPGNLRRSFRSRPLSSDLTKLFSGSPTGADTTRKSANESQDIREKERTPQFGRETKEAGNAWKSPQIAKMTFTDANPEKDGRSVKQRQSAPLPHSDISVSAAVHSVKTHPAPENAGVKTVRATMFEHNVERHTVAAKGLETERKSQPASDPITGQAGHSRESWVEKVLDAKVTSRKVSSMATDGEKARKTRPVNEDKTTQAPTAWEKRVSKERSDKIPTKPVEDSLVYQRIEPRYEILQMIGERVRSEAITTATEDKAVTLRSKRSLKERRRTDGVVADTAWSRSLDVQGEEISVPKVKNSGENAVNTTLTRDHPKGSSHERVSEVNRNWTGPQPATATAQKASYFTNMNKDWEWTEDKVFKPSSAETEKDHREAPFVDKTKEGPRTPKRFPEGFGVEVCESRASVEKSATGDCENVHRMSQWQTFARLSGDPPRISGQDESRLLSAQEGSDVSDRRSKGDGFRELGADERVGKSRRGASPPKPVERWRRKTLPHDAFRIEEDQERGKSPSRKDSFQFWDGSVTKGSAKPKEARDGRSSSESDLKNQLSSPSDSKATYFALTYQIPDGNENAPTKPSDPPKNEDVSSPASIPLSASVGKTHRLHGNRFTETQGSLDRDLGGDGDPSEIPFKYPQTERQNWDKERAADLGFPIQGSGAKSPSRRRSFHQDCKSPGHKKSSDPNRGVSNEKSADGYRSRVLDLDVLMAEYKEDAKRTSVVQGSLPEESKAISWEKSSRQHHSSDKTVRGYAQRWSDLSPGARKPGIAAAAEAKEISESNNQETLKARDVKRSPPHWGIQGLEKPMDQASAQKKTFIVDEEEGADLVRRHQTAKRMNYGGPLGAEMNFVPPSDASSEGGSWTGMKWETGIRKEVHLHAEVNLSGFSKRTVGASESGRDSDTSAAKRGPESGFANAPPDLRRSYSEKVRQSRVRGGGFPFGQKVEDQSGDHRSIPLPETMDNRSSKWSASPHGVFISDGKKTDVEKDGTKGPVPKNSTYLAIQRRSSSFYRERRTDHWPTDQLKQCFGRPAGGAKDTDTLVQETDNQYGTWEDQRESVDSFAPESPSSESVSVPARKPTSRSSHLSSFSSHTDPTSATDPPDSSRDRRSASPDRDSTDAESAELAAPSGTSPDFSFLDETPVLDSSALKTRVQLSKRRRQRRTPISNSLRRSGIQEEGQPRMSERGETNSTWMFKDSTGEKLSRGEESDEEGRPRPTERSPAPQPQRLPVFLGMDHSAFKAQLRKRHELEGTTGTGSGISAQSSRSPKSSFQAGVLHGSRMPPTTGTEKEERSEEISPQWLKELKSKKRQSQFENQV